MKKICLIILCAWFSSIVVAHAQTDIRIKQPDLQTTEFFDPTKEKVKEPYQFSTDWRIEAGYVQHAERTLDTISVYQHGVRLGGTIDLNLPHNFSIQTGALATLTYGRNDQHWYSLDQESAQVEYLNHNIVQLQLTIPVRAYYKVKLWKELNLFFFAGPQVQFGLTNYDIVENHTSPMCTQWLQDQGILLTNHDRYMTKEIYRTNIQFGLGGGMEWDRYRLQAGYDFGLNNLLRTMPIPNTQLHEWGWLLTFSYKL